MEAGYFHSTRIRRKNPLHRHFHLTVTGVLHIRIFYAGADPGLLLVRHCAHYARGKKLTGVPRRKDRTLMRPKAKVVAAWNQNRSRRTRNSGAAELALSLSWDRRAAQVGVLRFGPDYVPPPETALTTKPMIGLMSVTTQEGQCYRGLRMVNWDPDGRTALSDDGIYKEQSKLYHINNNIRL